MVPEEGIEPTLCCQNRILSPARLPVPPFRRGSRIIRESDPATKQRVSRKTSNAPRLPVARWISGHRWTSLIGYLLSFDVCGRVTGTDWVLPVRLECRMTAAAET
jgi:hypothetical protein